jgi:hypothetical protein
LHENSQEGGSLCAFIYRLVLPFTVLAQGYTAPFSRSSDHHLTKKVLVAILTKKKKNKPKKKKKGLFP